MYIDQNNLKWTRSEDLLSITCEDGRKVLGNEQMTDEYLVSVAYQTEMPIKSDAERIAELEALVQSLINK
jgi:hypothetical protein